MPAKQLRDMTEPELQKLMMDCAERVKWTLPKGTLFLVLAFENEGAGRGGITQYISNCDRSTMSAALRETADRFDRGEVVPR